MTKEQATKLQTLEGRHVSVALRDGSRVDDCQLVSAGYRRQAGRLWLFSNGADVFVPLVDVIEVWEALHGPGSRAA